MAAASFAAYANQDDANLLKYPRTYADGVKEYYAPSFAAKHFDALMLVTAKLQGDPGLQVPRLCPVPITADSCVQREAYVTTFLSS
jgi:hypothetical protein